MNYIDLNLKKHNNKEEKTYLLNDVIDDNKFIVILGSPGSGKTSIFKKYEELNNEAKIFTVKDFIKLNPEINEDNKIILLDGLDEYRSIEADKTFITKMLSKEIKKLGKNKKVVISCREMDWYGEKDKSALNTYIDEDFVLYNVEPLNNEKQLELAKVLKLETANEFVEKFTKYGFLSNPQIFIMLKEIYEQDEQQSIINKIDLYNKFVEFSLETNEEHSLNITPPSKDEIFKYAGYIAFYYMFCDIDNISDSFIDNIANEENYPKDKIKAVLKNTKLFNNEGFFIHRTIAEFLSAKFIFDCKYQSGTGKERIKGLFKLDGRIPTELRGCFSWLCALSSDFELIKIDPYYQIIHGDNSIFNIGLKKKIIFRSKKSC